MLLLCTTSAGLKPASRGLGVPAVVLAFLGDAVCCGGMPMLAGGRACVARAPPTTVRGERRSAVFDARWLADDGSGACCAFVGTPCSRIACGVMPVGDGTWRSELPLQPPLPPPSGSPFFLACDSGGAPRRLHLAVHRSSSTESPVSACDGFTPPAAVGGGAARLVFSLSAKVMWKGWRRLTAGNIKSSSAMRRSPGRFCRTCCTITRASSQQRSGNGRTSAAMMLATRSSMV
mmetsp:Transcript_24637/g.69266  ORF Transcript_24637/g.69266 Transcript_24637/m.69266 type:complete len:233 (-) Transcript_24637:350-1048(-)